jgi:hypothetical protein
VASAAHQGGPLKGPLEQAPPRSRVHASLERAPPRSRAHASLEWAPPRSRVHAYLEGAPHAHAHSRMRVRAFNALTVVGRCHHTPGTHAPVLLHQLSRGNPSRHCEGLCDMAGVSPVTPRRLLQYG